MNYYRVLHVTGCETKVATEHDLIDLIREVERPFVTVYSGTGGDSFALNVSHVASVVKLASPTAQRYLRPNDPTQLGRGVAS